MNERKLALIRKKQSDEEQLPSSHKRTDTPSTAAIYSPFKHGNSVTPQNALHLQRTIGNAAVQRMMIQRVVDYPDDVSQAPFSAEAIQDYEAFNTTRKVIYKYAAAEFSTENFECLAEIARYQKNPSAALARQIFNIYLKNADKQTASINVGGNGSEVNIGGGHLKEITAGIESTELDRNPSPDLFNGARDDLVANASDTYSRFRNKPDWRKAYRSFLSHRRPGFGARVKGFFSGIGKKIKGMF